MKNSVNASKKCFQCMSSECLSKKTTTTFCGFTMGSSQYWAGRVYDLCVFILRREHPTAQPKVVLVFDFVHRPSLNATYPLITPLNTDNFRLVRSVFVH